MNPTEGRLAEVLARLQASEGYVFVRNGTADDNPLVGLDMNENFFADADSIRRMAEEAARCDLRVYPGEEISRLREMLGMWLRVEPECVVLANGEDQLIDLATSVLLRGESAITISPTYSMYGLRVRLVGGKVIQVPLRKDFSLDVTGLISAADESRAFIMFLCSPNNPTGNQFPESDIVEILARYTGLVVVDEAYADFSNRSLASLVQSHPNLAVMRTFSKAFGIAGARLGYMIAGVQLSKAFTGKVQLPFPISRFTARLGIECLRNLDAMRDSVDEMKQERNWLVQRLRDLGLRVFDSESNFVLVCTGKDSSKILAKLRQLGVCIKNLGDVLDYRGCMRITVGTRPMNKKLLGALEEVKKNGQL